MHSTVANKPTQLFIVYFDRVQRVSGEDQANPSKASSEEVLQRADRLRLLGHVYSLQEGKRNE